MFFGGRSRKIFIRCGLVSVAGLVLSMVATIVILALRSPRFGMGQPWMDKALQVLEALLLFFSLFAIVLKFLVGISDRSGDSSE